MVLKVTNKGKNHYEEQEQEKPKRKKPKEKYEDKYYPMFPPTRMLVKETPDIKNGGTTKQYYEFRVQRSTQDEFGLPHVFITGYQESAKYTGYQKGRTVSFPLEALYEFIDKLQDLSDEADKRHIE